MGKVKDIAGMKAGRLTVVSLSHVEGGSAFWNCMCQCGQTKVISGKSIRSNVVASCGCIRIEQLIDRSTTHGQTGSPTYYSWANMIQRCTNPSHPRYEDWGGRGIQVCDRWHSFELFLEDMGVKPDGDFSIERLNNNKGYVRDNCKWATRLEQANNKRGYRYNPSSVRKPKSMAI